MDSLDVLVLLVIGIPSFLIGIVATAIGWRLLTRARAAAAPPAVPAARIANAEGGELVAAKAHRAGGKIARRVQFTFGLGLIVAPWAWLGWLVWSLLTGTDTHESHSKGRVLRVRNRAQLPELATGDGWTTGAIDLAVPDDAASRALLAELWLTTARMEHASIGAFARLSIELLALGAPADLLAQTQAAAADEVRHAQLAYGIASALAGTAQSAGPILALRDERPAAPDPVRLAIGSLIDGCLAEGLAADVAAAGAATATAPTIARALAMIARDEARHAELAWDVLAWCLVVAPARVEPALRARLAALGAELAPRLPDVPDVDPAALARYGLVDQDALGQLANARIAATQARAGALLAAAPRLARAA